MQRSRPARLHVGSHKMKGNIQSSHAKTEIAETPDSPNLFVKCCRAAVLRLELVVFLGLLGKAFYNPLSEQYLYFRYGSDILKNTSFIFPEGSFCVNSQMIIDFAGNDSYKHTQSLSDHVASYAQVASEVPSILVTLFLGPMMDRYGRKIGMIFPSVGVVLQGCVSIFIVTYELSPYYLILSSLFSGVFGGYTSVLAAIFSYTADVTSPRWRSLRIGAVEAALAAGICAGQLLGGYWMKAVSCNFVPLLYFFTACNAFLLVYVVAFLPESLSDRERKILQRKSHKGLRAYVEGFRLYFGGLSLPDTWKIYVATIVVNVAVINIFGSIFIDVFFLKAVPFDYNSLQIGIFQSLRSASQGLSNLFIVGVLSLLGVGDAWLMLLAIFVHSVCSVLIGLSTKAWELYTVAAVKGIEGIVWAGGRGLMSKLVKPEQQGALFSIIASLESLSSLLASIFWPFIYPITVQYNLRPGMTYVLIGAVGSCLLPLIISLLCLKKKQTSSVSTDLKPSPHSVDSESSSEEEYKSLLSNSWNSDKPYTVS